MAQDDVPGSSTGAPFISTGTNCPHMSVSFLVLVRVSQMASQSPRMLPGMRQTLICFSKQSLRLSYCLWGLWSCPASLTCAGDSLWTQLQLSKESWWLTQRPRNSFHEKFWVLTRWSHDAPKREECSHCVHCVVRELANPYGWRHIRLSQGYHKDAGLQHRHQ